MLVKKYDQNSNKVLKHNKTLLFSPAQGYIRPPEYGSLWWATTTSVWAVDELIGRRIRDWRRLTHEDGHSGTRNETMRQDHDSIYTGSHSVFPVPLAEWIMLRYAPREGGVVLDAFAGGPPRAIVSAFMGYSYIGYEIRQEQIDENKQIINNLGISGSITYHLGDGTQMAGMEPNSVDFAITCPPYYNLEKYSDLAEDLSNLETYEEFDQSMFHCAQAYFKALKPGSYVCLVCCPFRLGGNKDENELIDMPGDIVHTFKLAGFFLWQKIILSRNAASAAARSTTSWKGRKLISRHEELLVFRKPLPIEKKRKELKKGKS